MEQNEHSTPLAVASWNATHTISERPSLRAWVADALVRRDVEADVRREQRQGAMKRSMAAALRNQIRWHLDRYEVDLLDIAVIDTVPMSLTTLQDAELPAVICATTEVEGMQLFVWSWRHRVEEHSIMPCDLYVLLHCPVCHDAIGEPQQVRSTEALAHMLAASECDCGAGAVAA